MREVAAAILNMVLPPLGGSPKGKINDRQRERCGFLAIGAFLVTGTTIRIFADDTGSRVVWMGGAAMAVTAYLLGLSYYIGKSSLPRRTRVLIVEDDAPTYSGYGRYLSRAGYWVDYAGTIAAADMMLAYLPDAVVLDLGLPDGRGEDFIEVVRRKAPLSRVIVCTGSDDPAVRAAVQSRRPDALITKGRLTTPDEIMAAIAD